MQCHLEQEAPAGTYTISTRYLAQCPAQDPDECACPEGETSCSIYYDGEAPAPEMAEAQFDFPNETMPVIAIE